MWYIFVKIYFHVSSRYIGENWRASCARAGAAGRRPPLLARLGRGFGITAFQAYCGQEKLARAGNSWRRVSGRGARAGHGAQWLGFGGRGLSAGRGCRRAGRLAGKKTDGKAARKCVAARRRKAGRPFSEMA